MAHVETIAAATYHVIMLAGHAVCHQIPERSPHLFGLQFPLCWRCTGILLGTVVFFAWLLIRKTLFSARACLMLSALMPLDVLTAAAGLRDGDNRLRFITGILWGVFGTCLFLHALARTLVNRAEPPAVRGPRRGSRVGVVDAGG